MIAVAAAALTAAWLAASVSGGVTIGSITISPLAAAVGDAVNGSPDAGSTTVHAMRRPRPVGLGLFLDRFLFDVTF